MDGRFLRSINRIGSRGRRRAGSGRKAAGLFSIAALVSAALPAHGLTIIPTFDGTVTALTNSAQIQSAFNYAAQQYQSLYSDPITINITVSANTSANPGTSNTNLETVTYAALRNALTTDAKTVNDTTAVASLGATDPTGSTIFLLATAEAKALGLHAGNDSATDGTFTFNPTSNYTFDPAHRASTGQQDFIGVAEHEISEIMGRIGVFGKALTGANAVNHTPYELFRYKGIGTRALILTDTGTYFSINGGVTNLKNFNDTAGGDIVDWAAGQGPDAFNAAGFVGVANDITAVDSVALDVIGYDLPEPTSLGLLALGSLGLLSRRRKRD